MKETSIVMTKYQPENGWVKGKNRPFFSNRYIYEGNTSVYIMAGDRPLIRLAEKRVLLGTLRLFYGKKALEDCADIEMRYRSGMVEWKISDPEIPEEIKITVTSPGDGMGIVLRVDSKQELSFQYGGLSCGTPEPDVPKSWNFDVLTSETDRELLKVRFREEWLEGNQASWSEDKKEIVLTDSDIERSVYVKSDRSFTVEGCQAVGKIGTYFSACLAAGVDSEMAFAAGCMRSERLTGMLKVTTPDEYLNAACAVAAGEVDGAWHGTKTFHGNMRWSQPFLGWLAHYPHAMFGYHDRAKRLLKAYAAAQVKTEDNIGYDMDDTYTVPASHSRFYGKGHISEDQFFYNMQTQFFHQMISAWRFSGDEEFAELLREALRLHIEWEDACFDPENTGLYASVINTWPTDSVSYSDAGAVEETAYAYVARCAMAELTEGEESKAYARKAERIKEAFFKELWISEKGYPGVYRERGGRLHEEAWIYSSFLPVECNLVDQFQAAQALYYPLWAFERGENGGFWFSNWTPGIWSVRENKGGENMQQACAFFKGGNVEEGIEILGKAARSYLDGDVPGEMMVPIIETATIFVKTVVEGLFGYYPDYPNHCVTIAPALPFAWGQASIETGDVKIQWERRKIRVRLKKPAELTIRMRLFADELYEVTGADEWHLEPGIGGMIVVLKPGKCEMAEIELHTSEERDFIPYEDAYSVPVGKDIFNPQGINPASYGEHMAFRKMPGGYFREIRVHLGQDPKKVELRKRQCAKIPQGAEFEKVDIAEIYNADVTQIFKNKYMSPRPKKGCYVQIGLDGFSYWTFPKWGVKPPEMKLEKCGVVKSTEGIPFAVSSKGTNIAFASLWDNYPNSVEAFVGKPAKMAAVLIAGSTSPMQCGIENARLTFCYEDGETEELPLVNPENYISLCAYPERAAAGYQNVKRNDVFNEVDISLMKNFTPEILELGKNIRALSVRWPLMEGKVLKSVRLTACSQDIVVGLMGITLIL